MFGNAVDPDREVLRPLIVDLTSISHDGKTIIVGTAPDGILYYTVRQSGFEDTALSNAVEQTMPGFENWARVPLTLSTDDPSVRAHEVANLVDDDGAPIIRSRYGTEAERSAVARVKLVSGLGHLYLFRVSTDNKLLMNRFVLDGMTNDLVPKLEVRFRRSEQKLVPDGGSSPDGGGVETDSLGFRNPDQVPFYEPTQELSFLGTFAPGKPWFSVEVLPTSEHERHRWNFFVHTDDELRLVSVAASADGLFDLKDQAKVQQDPDKIDKKIVRTIPGIVDRRLQVDGRVVNAFDSTIYHNQVERQTKSGPQLLKENTRVMLSVPVQQSDREGPTIATVSFAVNNLGQLAQIDRVADRDELLNGDVKEVLLPLSDLEDIKLIADRTPPPEGAIVKLAESQNQFVEISTGTRVDGSVKSGQKVKLSGTRSYDGVYTAIAVEDGNFEIDAVFDKGEEDQGFWEVVEDEEKGLVFENMIASYERTENGGLKISCLSHNIEVGDEIRITGSVGHDGVYPISNVTDDNSFELDLAWPAGEVVNLSRRPRRGLYFDGRGDCLQVAPVEFPPHFSRARLERTVRAWVYLSEITGEPQTIFATNSGLLSLSVDGDGLLTFQVSFADGHQARVVDTAPLPVQQWTHVTAMLDYQGETTGETSLVLCRSGNKTAETIVEPRKPLHLPIRNARLGRQALPFSTVQYDIALPEEITLEAWVSTRQNGRNVVASWYQNGQFVLAVSGDRSRRVVQWWTGGDRMDGTVHLPNDDWHHLAVTYDPAKGEKSIFVNGRLDSTRTTVTAAVDDVTREMAATASAAAKATKKPFWLGFLGASAAETTPKGRDVNAVFFDGGAFKQVSTRRWRQVDSKGSASGDTLTEIGRDEWSVYLRADDRSYRMSFDLHRRKVRRTEFNVESDAGRVTSSVAVNGWNTNRVDYAGGSWQKTGDTTWEHFDRSGTATGESRTEDARDEWSVYFHEPNSTFHQFDLWRKKICFWDHGNRADVHDVTGSAAPADGGGVALNGQNVRRVDVGGGRYEAMGDGRWQRYTSSGAADGAPFTEVQRTAWSVVLGDPTGRYQIRVNLFDNTITRIDNEVTSDVHDITDATVPARDPSAEDRFDGFLADVRVWNKVRSPNVIARDTQERLTGTERNLIAHWPLEETAARELGDATRNKAHVTLPEGAEVAWFVEPHRAPGARSHYEGQAYTDSLTIGAQLDHSDQYALELDGTNDHLSVPALSEDLSGGFTVAAWARWDGFHHWSRVIDFRGGTGEDYLVLANEGTTSRLVFETSSGRVHLDNALRLGEWFHVAATVGSDGTHTLYVNGQARATGSGGVPGSVRRTKNYIGRSYWDRDGYFHGALRDVQFWGTALPASDVAYYMNIPPQGIEDHLLHHWPMRTATIRGRKRVVDQGVGTACHADLQGGATSVRLSDDLPPVARTELRGKLSDVQLWDVNPPLETIRETMHDPLTGNEYGLVGYWRCGGILQDPTPGSTTRITPDFAADGHDARVLGDVFVSAVDLPRRNSVGRAVRYSNDDLVAVTQGARYRETFEFRAETYLGDVLSLLEVTDADQRNNPLFGFSYWGQKSRTDNQRIPFRADESYDFVDLGGGWFRAQCDITVPDGVNLIRCFEIDDVTGVWTDEEDPPDEEWMHLSIRKHRLELISNSISRRTYTDTLELPTLVDDASELEDEIKKIPAKEREIVAERVELEQVLENLLVFVNRVRFESERDSLQASTQRLRSTVDGLNAEIGAYPDDPLNYRYVLRSKDSGKVLDYSGRTNAYLYREHAGSNQAWEFQRTDVPGHYRIAVVSTARHLVITAHGHSVYLGSGDNNHFRWTVSEAPGGYYTIGNVATGGLLDVFAFGKADRSLITTWGRTGTNNQLWQLVPWYPQLADVRRLENQRDQAQREANRDLFAGHHPLHRQMFRHHQEAHTRAWQQQADSFDRAASDARSRHAGRQKKSTYDAELQGLTRRRDQAAAQLGTETARLTWLRGALANTTPEREAELLTRRAALEERIGTLQREINDLNTSYIETAKLVLSEAQTMGLVAEDPLGLKTYGAILGFAAPTSGVTSAATAEGNVALSYFDTEGRLRFSNYDATSDSTNAAYEQWLPATIAVCPDLRRPASMLALHPETPVQIGPGHHTTEAWFSFPPPFAEDGRPYRISQLTSDASGQQAAIALAQNRRLGTVVDGFFHDAGIDLGQYLDRGWHHVAARAEGSATLFFLDGEPVGHTGEEQLASQRFAMTFNGTESYLTAGRMAAATHNYSQGFSVQTWARIDGLGRNPRIIDFGSAGVDNIVFHLGNHNTDLCFVAAGRKVAAPNVVQVGRWMNLAATASNGIAVIYVDGVEVARAELPNPPSVDRTQNYIGRSNWHTHGETDLHGALSGVHVWNRALSAAEVHDYMYTPPAGDEGGLLHYWPMSTTEIGNDQTLMAEDGVATNPLHAALSAGVSSQLLDRSLTEPIVALGNNVHGGAPAGKIAELRFWSVALPDEEIRVHSLVTLTGNEPELEACYPLDDILGPEAVAGDITGNHRPVSLVAANPVARTARIGNPGATVVEFDGASQVTVGGVNLANRSFTIEFWIKRDRVDCGEWVLFQGRNARNKGLHLGFRPNNKYAFAFYANDLNIGTGTDPLNEWLHVANVYDAQARTQTVYFDGRRAGRRANAAALEASGDLLIGRRSGGGHVRGQLAELRVWDHARNTEQIADGFGRRAVGTEPGLMLCLPFNSADLANKVPGAAAAVADGNLRFVRTDDLPIRPGPSLVTAEYNTVGVDPRQPTQQRAVLRRFYGFADENGAVALLPGKRVEELALKWIGNAQFEPTLLGYMEGAPPVPSENLTINYDYDAATSVELIQSDEITYSWNRNRDIGGGLDANFFLGAGWSMSGGAFIESQISEGHVGARGNVNAQWRRNEASTIRASSTEEQRDRLDLRGTYEIEPGFPHLGNRFVPKNVGYALVVSGLADVFITQMKRTGRMVAYEILPVEDVPPDVNTITFIINPSYTLNGSLDGLVGSRAADPRFFRHVPEMRAQYGSRYPASYFNLQQAYDLKSQIERWDQQRESYFTNFDARETGLTDSLLDQVPDEDEADSYGQVTVDDGTGADGEAEVSGAEARDSAAQAYERRSQSGKGAAEAKRKEIEARFADQDKQMEANAAFAAWQRRMEGLQIRAGKRNIVNTYVWDADGGVRSEEQSFANTVEHTIGGTFSLNASLGLDANVTVSGFKFELQAMGTFEMSQTMSKTAASTRSFDLNVRLDGVEKKGVTDAEDLPLMPGEKVDRYRFMSFYLEGDTDHFTDFFNYVVDPEWLMSNDEEARALRQVARGRPNKTWRVMHRVTYVERPALMGIGQDLRTADDLEQATQEVFNYFDALEQNTDALSADIGGLRAQLTQIEGKINELAEANRRQEQAAPPAVTPATGQGGQST